MRVVESEADFESQMDRAISEAIAALEMALFYRKICGFIRHIEIQVMNSVGMCCIYSKNAASSVVTKVIEEAPSSVLTELRKKNGRRSRFGAKSCDYLGAGTVEFYWTKIIISTSWR
jgi:propionyl-CoA carboxylase alpha chain